MQVSFKTLLGLTVIGLVGLPVALAQPPSTSRPPAPPPARAAQPQRPAGGGYAIFQLLGMQAVRQELGLKSEQQQKLDQITQQYYQEQQQWAAQLQGTPPAQQQQKLAQLQQQAAQRVDQVAMEIQQLLTPQQRSQLENILFQVTAYNLLHSPSAIEQLRLSSQQTQQLQKILQQAQEQMWKAQQEASKEVLKVLTPEQQEQLKNLQAQAATAQPQPQR